MQFALVMMNGALSRGLNNNMMTTRMRTSSTESHAGR